MTPGQLKEEFWVANTRSQAIASWNPAAAAIPFTAHMVGMEIDRSLNIRPAAKSKISAGFLDAWIYFKSWPAENTGPSALIIRI